MMNITISIDDEIYRRVQLKAAELNMSVSAMVQNCLNGISSGVSERVPPEQFERLKQLLHEVQSRVTNFNADDRLSRDELHDRQHS